MFFYFLLAWLVPNLGAFSATKRPWMSVREASPDDFSDAGLSLLSLSTPFLFSTCTEG